MRAAGLPLLRLLSAGISFKLGLSRSLSGLKFLVVRTTCDGCLVTEAINDPLMPLLGSIASCVIKVDRSSRKHHYLLRNLVLEKHIYKLSYAVGAPKPHGTKRKISDSVDQACPYRAAGFTSCM